MVPIAFNAGDIQATLTLDRSPFQRGLDEAKAEADRFAQGKYEAKLGADSTEAKRQITEARTEAERFSTIDAKAKIGVEAASLAEIDAARAKLDEFSTLDVKARIGIDSSGVAGEVERAKAQVRDFAAQSATLQVNADTSAARAQLAQLDRTAMAPKELKVTAQIQTALSNIDQVTARLAELQAKRTDPKIDLDIEAAKVKQVQLVNQLDALQAKKTDPKIDLDILTAKYNLEQLAMQLEQLSDKPWSPKVDAEMAPLALKVAQAQARLEQLEARKTDPKIDADIAGLLVKIAQSEKLLQDLAAKKVDPQVDLDIAAAQAKLAMLHAQLAGLQAPAESAAAGMSQFQKYALLAGAATPFIAAGIVALPGLIAAAVVPMAAVASGMDGIKQAVTGLAPALNGMNAQVSQVFAQGLQPAIRNIAALIPTLTTGLSGTAGALSRMATQITGVVSSASGLETMRSIFSGVDQVITSLGPGIATFTSNVMSLASAGLPALQGLGTMLDQVGQAWRQVIDQMNATGTTQAAISALIDVLGGVLNLMPPLVQAGAQLMATLGPPLAVALNAVAAVLGFLSGPLGDVTTTVLAMVVAWKAASVAVDLFSTGMGKVSGAVSKIATAAAGASTGINATAVATRSAGTAAEEAATKTSRLGSAMSGIGVALPVIAVAVTGFVVAMDALSVSSDDAVNAFMQGGQAAADMTAKIENQNPSLQENASWVDKVNHSVNAWVYGLLGIAPSVEDVTRKVDAQRAAMTPLQLAQADVTKATNDLGMAQKSNDPAKITQATKDLAAANIALSQAQGQAAVSGADIGMSMQAASAQFGSAAVAAADAATSTKSWADAFTVLADQSSSASDKVKAFGAAFQGVSDSSRTFLSNQLAASTALDKFGASLGQIPAGVVALSGAINTSSKAGQDLATNVLAASKAYDGLYGATLQASQAAGDSMPVALGKAAAATENYRAKLVDEAVQHGVNRQAAEAMINTYLGVPKEVATSFQTPGAVEATAAALGVKGAVASLPDHKGIIIDAKGNDELIAKLRDLGLQITTLPNGKVIVTADTQLLPSQIHDGVGAALIQLGQPKVPVGIDPTPAKTALPVLQQDVANTPGALPVGANGLPLQQQLPGLVGQVTGTTANIGLGANPAAAQGTITATVAFGNGQVGRMTFDANPDPATGKITGTVALGNGQRATMTFDANPSPADGKIHGTVDMGNGQRATMTLDANPAQARGQISGTVSFGNGQTATIRVNADISAAEAAIARAARPRTAVINVVASGAPSIRNIPGTATPAGGGVVGYSAGGMVGFGRGGVLPGYQPGKDTIPAVLSAGEAVLVPELVKLLGPSNIIAANYAASGRTAAVMAGPSGRRPAIGGGGNVDDFFERMRGFLGSGAPMPDLSPLRSQVSGLRASASTRSGGGGQSAASVIAKLDELLVALKTMKTSTVTTHVEVATTAAETASEIARVLARQEALGIFG